MLLHEIPSYPQSGSGSDSGAAQLPSLNEQLRERIGAMDIVMTVAPGDAHKAAAEAAQAGYDTLFIAGGDGTLNQVLNGVASVDGASRESLSE